MPLFNARLIEKNIKNSKPLPSEHEAITTEWAENLRPHVRGNPDHRGGN